MDASMPAAAVSYTANGGLTSSSLPSTSSGSHHSSIAGVPGAPLASMAAQGLSLGPSAAAVAAAGRDDNLLRALAFVEEPASAALAQTANGSSNGFCSTDGNANGPVAISGSSGPDGREGGNGANVAALGENLACGEDTESDAPHPRSSEAGASRTALGGYSSDEASSRKVSTGLSALSGLTKASWREGLFVASTSGNTSNARAGLAENGSGAVRAGLDSRTNGDTAASSGSAGDESDVGSVDEDNDDYTWFSSERRASGGERRHGRGRGGGKVYDRVMISDCAEEINALKQQLADGTIEENEGKEKLRELEAKNFTIKIGDTIEIHSGNEAQPYVGKLIQLDRGTRRFRVRWYFVSHEVDDQLAEDMEPKEILLSDCLSTYQLLDSVDRKVDTVRKRPPPPQEIPANTYLCYRGYDIKSKMIVDLLENDTLCRKNRRGKPNTKKGQARAEAASTGASSAVVPFTPPRTLSSSSIMSPSNLSQSQEDSDRSNSVFLKRWNRVGPDFDVAVPAWTGPSSGRLTPPPGERTAALLQLDQQQQWSSEDPPFQVDALHEYLAKAKAVAPMFPGTIVYIRLQPGGLWGDGGDRKQVRSSSGSGSGGGRSGTGRDSTTGPCLSSIVRSTYGWGLVSKAPLPAQQLQLAREQGPSQAKATLARGESNVANVQQIQQQQQQQQHTRHQQQLASASTGLDMSMAPQWLRQQEMHQQLLCEPLMQHQHHRNAMFGNGFRPQLQLPANPALHHDWLRQGGLGDAMVSPSLAALGTAPASTFAVHGNHYAAAPSSVPGVAIARVGDGAGEQDSVVWIANPSEGSLPLQVERSRVMGQEFEEEAMNVLWDARGDFGVALSIICSKEYQDGLKARLEGSGQIWTFQQVKAAVKTCTKVATERRNEDDGELGDDLTDEGTYGVASKPFRCVVDFGRRFATLSRFGQQTKRRAATEASQAVEAAAAAAATQPATRTTAKRQRPKPGTYIDNRSKRRAVGVGGGSARNGGRKQAQSDNDNGEEEEDEEDDSDSSEDTNYNPDDSEGSSLIFLRHKKRHRRRKEADEGGSSGEDSSWEDRKDNIAPPPENPSSTPTSTPVDHPHGVVYDLCASDEDEEDNVIRANPNDDASASTSASSAAMGWSSVALRGEREGGVSDERHHATATAPATVAEVAAAAAVQETQGVAAEAAAKAEADGAVGENAGSVTAPGGRGREAGVPSVFPNEAHSRRSIPKSGGDGGGCSSDMTPPARDDSPVPGVASGNTGGEAMAPRQQDISDILHVFMARCQATLTQELFEKFVSALTQYRAHRLVIGELVELVGECFNHREEQEMKLVNEFNSFLPPGNAVRYAQT